MMGFKEFHSAEATISGIETAHMIRKGQSNTSGKAGGLKTVNRSKRVNSFTT